MAELSLKQQFVRLLREVLRDSGMTRGELVAHLGISASAVSQMLNGGLLPTVARLDQIIEALHPSVENAEKLQNMVLWLRAGATREHSDFNRRLFMERCRSALTIDQLAAASAISAARLRRLESTAYAVPTSDEAAILSGIFGVPLTDDVLTAGGDGHSAPLEAADSLNVVLPKITADVLSEYSAGKDLLKYVDANSIGFLAFHLLPTEAVAVVCAPAKRFGVALPGMLELVLGNARPKGFMRLELCREKNGGGFFVDGDAALYGNWLPSNGKGKKKAAWRLPVLQMNHIPEGVSDVFQV